MNYTPPTLAFDGCEFAQLRVQQIWLASSKGILFFPRQSGIPADYKFVISNYSNYEFTSQNFTSFLYQFVSLPFIISAYVSFFCHQVLHHRCKIFQFLKNTFPAHNLSRLKRFVDLWEHLFPVFPIANCVLDKYSPLK